MLLPDCVLDRFHHGAVNVHPSLLPRYRGSAPIQAALLHGDSETGVCVMGLSPRRFDHGDILRRVHVPVPPVSCRTHPHAPMIT